MRIWHKDLVKYLPRTQLIAQWRELNSVFKKQDNHILINYIYSYSKEYLLYYSDLIVREFKKRNFRINKLDNFNNYFGGDIPIWAIPVNEILEASNGYTEHNDRYLLQCFFNLQEKKDRGQSDFSEIEYQNLLAYMKNKFPAYSDMFEISS